ncbi:MAG TPA: ATP-binding protein [Planctomycetota bacterium]|nr:ATP-binding protein [Planctomycetota bacterium]
MNSLIAAIAVLIVATASWLIARRALRRQSVRDRQEAQRTREEEHAALIGTLASGLAHEIRNPLGTLSLNLQLLQEDWADPVSDREQKSARKIGVLLKEVRHLENILNEFLKFAAKPRLNLERVNLNKILEELLDFITPQAAHANVRLIRHLSPAAPPAQIDPERIRQSLLNLLLNALQAMPKGGDLEVSTEPAPGHCRIRVRDTGVGIPPEHIDQIFNLYFSTKPAGTGLGLPMAKKIVDEHHGAITVESAPGKGSVFTVDLPTLDAHPPTDNDRSP